MKPETGVQPWDAKHVSSGDAGRARLHEKHQDAERGARPSDDPLTKFKRVWSEEYRGNSGTQHLKGR